MAYVIPYTDIPLPPRQTNGMPNLGYNSGSAYIRAPFGRTLRLQVESVHIVLSRAVSRASRRYGTHSWLYTTLGVFSIQTLEIDKLLYRGIVETLASTRLPGGADETPR